MSSRSGLAALRSLRGRRIRYFFAGQLVSLTGRWMQQVALSWLVYRLTGSAVLLGVIAFASQIPALVLAPLGGALADRWSRYRLVFGAQSLAMIQASVLAVIVLAGWVETWHLVALALVGGIARGVDVPARQSLLVQLVDRPDDLPNAIALHSSLFNSARIVGPALGGLMVAWVGEGPVFAINAVSYLAVLAALAVIDPGKPTPKVTDSFLESLRAGARYAWEHRPIRALLTLVAVLSLVGRPYSVLLPVFASDILGGGSETLGWLTAAAGVGALSGALFLASRPSVRGLGTLLFRFCLVFGVSLIAFSRVQNLALAILCLVFIGFGILVVTAGTNTVIQTLVDEEMRGRVMSLYAVAFVGIGPIGSLASGWIAERWGAPFAVALGGVGCVLLAAHFRIQLPSLRALARPGIERSEAAARAH